VFLWRDLRALWALPSGLDYYLAFKGVSGQQTSTPVSETREDFRNP